MDYLRQTVGTSASSFLKQNAMPNEYKRVPEWLKTAGETVGYVGQTAGRLAGDLAGPLAKAFL